MAQPVTEHLDGGVVTSRDPTHLGPGELQRAIGCWYRPLDRRLWKQRGRVVFGNTGSGAKVKGVKLLQFDSGGEDRLVALSGTVLYGAPSPGTTGTFASLRTGLDSSATSLSAAHYSDRWYLTTDGDADAVFVVENDGTAYTAGLQPYSLAPTVTVSAAGGTIIRPGATAGDMTSGSLAIDSNSDTYGIMDLSAAATKTQTFTWSAGGSAARDLIVKFALQGPGFLGDDPVPYRSKVSDSGGATSTGWEVTMKLEFSSDNGANYTTILENRTPQAQAPWTFQSSVGTVNPAGTACILRATLTYHAGLNATAWRFYDVRLQTGSATTNFTTTTGMYYAATELDQTRGVRSPIKASTTITTLSAQNQVQITRPTQVNSRATHWEVWRTSDGGTPPYDFGRLAVVPISQTTYKDDFVEYPHTQSPPLKPNYLAVTVDGVSLLFEMDQPPPNLDRIMSFQNSLLGIKGRELRYALSGFPESWPEIYTISAFESEEHDELVSGIDLGELFILGGVANMRRISSLPRVAVGNFAYSPPEVISAAPGCTGPYSMAKFSVGGEPRCAWISEYGIYQTNGYAVQRISDDWDWSGLEGFDKTGWVIHYDPDRFVLKVAYSSSASGENDRYALAHVHPSHMKGDQPKWTLGHYGDIADLCSGRIAGQRRLYSGHTSDGKVYTEDEGETDESLAYNADGDWPMLVTTRRIHGGGKEFSVLKAWLRHTDFGAQTATVGWTTGRDESTSATRSISCSLEDRERTMFDVARGGEWHEVSIEHVAESSGAIGELSFEVRPLGGQGVVKVA